MGSAILMGLCMGLYYNRRRLMSVFGLCNGWSRIPLYSKDPWKQIIIAMIIAAVFMGGFPMEAFAYSPAYRPVFYYYHADRLGSSSVMTDWSGAVVQHYGYTAFGKERYKQETAAFEVTSRYTGQKLDEDTGLYFYGSRYYDAELGRFVQPDSVVPSATTSQALNRYTYVTNNPLKYDDPTGHGNWFKENIGTIITVALYFTPLAPIAPIIGAAVSTLVNHGTFTSFAVGMGIGFAAGYVAGSITGVNNMQGTSLEQFMQDPIRVAANGALAGALSGAATSAVYGQNIGEGMLQGMYGGLMGAGVAVATATVISGGASVLKDLFGTTKPSYVGGSNANCSEPNPPGYTRPMYERSILRSPIDKILDEMNPLLQNPEHRAVCDALDAKALESLGDGRERGGFMGTGSSGAHTEPSYSPVGDAGSLQMVPTEHPSITGPYATNNGGVGYDSKAPAFHIHTITDCAAQNTLNENFSNPPDIPWQRSWGNPSYIMTPTGRVLYMQHSNSVPVAIRD